MSTVDQDLDVPAATAHRTRAQGDAEVTSARLARVGTSRCAGCFRCATRLPAPPLDPVRHR